MSREASHQDLSERDGRVYRGIIALLLVLGLAALVLNAVLAFEESSNWLLFSALIFCWRPSWL